MCECLWEALGWRGIKAAFVQVAVDVVSGCTMFSVCMVCPVGLDTSRAWGAYVQQKLIFFPSYVPGSPGPTAQPVARNPSASIFWDNRSVSTGVYDS